MTLYSGKCIQCGGSKKKSLCPICINCQNKRGLIILSIALILLLLLGGIGLAKLI